jgi:chromosomal replication initiation ATPase DnaA
MIEDALQDPRTPTAKLLELLFVNHGSGLPPTQPTAKDWFWMVKDSAPPKVEDIKRAVCRHFNISMGDLLSDRRDHSAVMPRQIGMYVAICLSQKGFAEVARRFGRSDHTTSRSAFRKIDRLVKEDWKVAYDVAHLEDMFQ